MWREMAYYEGNVVMGRVAAVKKDCDAIGGGGAWRW